MVAMDSIGRYRLVRRIGAGSFATVWLGHDDDLDVPVAVKVLADNWASNSDVRMCSTGTTSSTVMSLRGICCSVAPATARLAS
jgi:hypothetical protein